MAVHNRGFLAAHDRRVKATRAAFDKQCRDADRARTKRYPHVASPLDSRGRPRDRHVVEQIVQDRQEERLAAKSIASRRSKSLQYSRREPLPPEDKAFERAPHRIYNYS
jgi:hypothetical protein